MPEEAVAELAAPALKERAAAMFSGIAGVPVASGKLIAATDPTLRMIRDAFWGWAPQSQRHGAFAQESRARLFLRRRYPPRCRRVRRSTEMLGAAGAGLQLLLGPGTSGFDVTFL